MNAQCLAMVRARLQVLAPTHLEVIDESHLHIGHAGAENGASHVRVKIVSPQFAHLSALARHRLVYAQVHDLIPFPIHALAIVASAVLSEGSP